MANSHQIELVRKQHGNPLLLRIAVCFEILLDFNDPINGCGYCE